VKVGNVFQEKRDVGECVGKTHPLCSTNTYWHAAIEGSR